MKQLLAALLLTVFIGCDKENKRVSEPKDDLQATFYYGQTQCADKWGYSRDDENTKIMLRDYLKSKGITVVVKDLTKAPSDVAYCAACTCASGRTFVVKANAADEDKLKAEGFYR